MKISTTCRHDVKVSNSGEGKCKADRTSWSLSDPSKELISTKESDMGMPISSVSFVVGVSKAGWSRLNLLSNALLWCNLAISSDEPLHP